MFSRACVYYLTARNSLNIMRDNQEENLILSSYFSLKILQVATLPLYFKESRILGWEYNILSCSESSFQY